ncbi:MAG: hypothetical protein AAGE96_07580 [Cyanobacteria bacterium P01_G01_bin.19]
MSTNKDNSDQQEGKLVHISSETNDLVEQEMAGENDQIKAETKALVEAIKTRAQSEIENAQNITKDAYLNAIRNAREAVEKNELLDPKRIEHSVTMIQRDVEANWQKTLDEMASFGDRLQEAAQTAWDIIMGNDTQKK